MIEVNETQGNDILSPAHSRAARAWMGWSLSDAEEKLGIQRDVLSRFERGARPISKKTRQRVVGKLLEHGVQLLPDGLRFLMSEN